ncbi:MAG: hypothetical protein L6Q83_08235 [Gammaproteobacteria bacterium]|nr:hypothetical protein [Gammaproteobacteria bacterium]
MSLKPKHGKPHGQIDVDVLESAAWNSLPHFARVLCIAIAANFRGGDNGSLTATWPTARKRGIRSYGQFTKGLALLQDRGLIIKTVQGEQRGVRPLPSRYAITWKPINERRDGGYEFGIVATRIAPDNWRDWQPSVHEAAAKAQRSAALAARFSKGRQTTTNPKPPVVPASKKDPKPPVVDAETTGGFGKRRFPKPRVVARAETTGGSLYRYLREASIPAEDE